MAIGTGFGATLALAEQVDFDTAIGAPTNALKVVSIGLKKTIDKVPLPHLGCHGSSSRVRRRRFTARETAGGTVEVVASYDDSTVLLCKHALGAVNTTGSGPYAHVISLSLDAPAPLTVWQLNGQLGGAERFIGLYVNQWELKLSQGDVMRLVLGDVIAKEGEGLAAAQPVVTLPTANEPILHSHAAASNITYNGNGYKLVSFSIKGDRKLTRRQLLGSKLTQQPLPSDFYEVTGTLVLELDPTDALDNDWKTDTTADANITLTGSGNNELQIDLDNVFITDISAPVSAAGVVQRTVTFMCQAGAAGEGIELRFINDNANATDNG